MNETELVVGSLVETGVWVRCGPDGDDLDYVGDVKGKFVGVEYSQGVIAVTHFKRNEIGAEFVPIDPQRFHYGRKLGQFTAALHNIHPVKG